MRIQRTGLQVTGKSFAIHFDGEPVEALEGETVAAALAAAGHRTLRRTTGGEPRGLYCGMGACFECRVTVDGRAGVRACMTMAAPDMDVRTTLPSFDAGAPSQLPLPAEDDYTQAACALLIIGAGPAGLAAAEAAAAQGVDTVILDERPSPGGQYYKPVAASHQVTGELPDKQFADGAALLARVQSHGVRIFKGTLVWDARREAEDVVRVMTQSADGVVQWTARRLLVATGAYERPVPVPGWTLPGVMTPGAAQTLARAYQVSPGERVLVAGHGPLNLQVAADLVEHGVKVVAVAERAAAPWRASPFVLWRAWVARDDLMRDGIRYLTRLKRAGVPIFHGHMLLRVEGAGRAERAVIARMASRGRICGGSERTFEVDTVCASAGFMPATELTRLIGCTHAPDTRHVAALVADRDENGRTSVREVFIAGDTGGPWGSQASLQQGRIAGLAIAADLGADAALIARQSLTARRRLAREQDFQRNLWKIFAAPDPRDALIPGDTLACRCENVSFAQVRTAIDEGASDLAQVKRATRCGMGHCQGRFCSPTVARMLAPDAVAANTQFRVQTPLRPVPMHVLARLREDITEFAALPEAVTRAEAPPKDVLGVAETLVIGGGIVGLSIARELALAGQAVIVLERHQPHAEASGANAGSLHVQFQTFSYPELSDEAVRAPVSTLALQRDSVHLWDEFSHATGEDLEIGLDGGLTVADDAHSLAHLKRKVELERRAGLAMEMITGDEARALAPCLSSDIIAASLSRDEGKINPLKAAPAMLRAALQAGVKVETETCVRTIVKDSPGAFTIGTDRGVFKAQRVVNAAGAWAGSVGALAGDPLPVRRNAIQMLVTEALPPVMPYHLLHASRRLTLKQAASGNLIIGGGWRARWDATAGRARPSVEGIAGNLGVAQRILPGMGSVQVIRSWTGTAFVTPPAIGESARVPGLFHAVSQNGMTLGPAIGRMGARLILGRAPEYDLTVFSPARLG